MEKLTIDMLKRTKSFLDEVESRPRIGSIDNPYVVAYNEVPASEWQGVWKKGDENPFKHPHHGYIYVLT